MSVGLMLAAAFVFLIRSIALSLDLTGQICRNWNEAGLVTKHFIQTTFKTSDGVNLSYLRAENGLPVILLHGFLESGACFKSQAQILAEQYNVIVLDQRSHGESEKVPFGLQVARLSKELFELVTALNLERVSLLGHSMGAAVIWSYIELFGDAELSKLILIDQSPVLTSNPNWTEQELSESGAIFDAQRLYNTIVILREGSGEEFLRQVFDLWVSKKATSEVKESLLRNALKVPFDYARTLMYDHWLNDWRETIPRIRLPTLVVSGRASPIPWKSQEWIHRKIIGSQLVIFEEEEGGKHFMFLENPQRFNRVLIEFLAR
jgi:non-heme chloroperoxidase